MAEKGLDGRDGWMSKGNTIYLANKTRGLLL